MQQTRAHIPDDDLAEYLKLPRHVLALDKRVLRQFLARPIKVYKVAKERPAVEQRRMISQQTDDKIKAMFALFDVPDGWPEAMQWQQLALCLAGERFAGCKTLARGLGGPTQETLDRKNELKAAVFKDFEEMRERAHLSDPAVARSFFAESKRRAACHQAGWRKPKSLTQAMKKMREK
jgi:hypothetical protein